MEDNFPVRRASIEELAGHRDRALQLAEQGIRLLVDADDAARRAAPGDNYAGFLSGSHELLRGLRYAESRERGVTDNMNDIRKMIDRSCWLDLQARSGLRNLLDSQGQQEFYKSVDKDPPHFTTDAAYDSFMQAASQAGDIFTRSIVNVFESLNTRSYKTNSAFGFGKRIIFSSAFSGWGGWNHHGKAEALIRDLDRVMHVLDGVKPPEAGTFADLIDKTKRERRSVTCASPYFHARLWSESLHLSFMRDDLVALANNHLRTHYGPTIPDNRKSPR